MNHDIFISYSSQDMEAAQAICHMLEQNEIKCWIASRDIPSGSDYEDVIDEAIESCRVVVVLFSETAASSPMVTAELRVASDLKKTIISFRLDATPIEGRNRFFLGLFHWIDAYPDYHTKLNDLLLNVSYITGKDIRKVEKSINLTTKRLCMSQVPFPNTNSLTNEERCDIKSLDQIERNIKEYDIFISYRRKDKEGNVAGRDIARGFKHYLESKGYTCFFDYSECDDGEFEDIIIPAVGHSKYFLLVMTNGALDRCLDERDWVRREFCEAINKKLKIVPIAITDNEHPEISFHGLPLLLPSPLNKLETIQWSEVSMGSLYEVSVDLMIKRRIKNNK